MKRQQLIKYIVANGSHFKIGLQSHIYYNKATNQISAVGRHKELDDLLCKKIVNNWELNQSIKITDW